MVNDVLENLMVHFGENYDLIKWLQRSQNVVGVWPHLEDLVITNTIGGVLIEAAYVWVIWLTLIVPAVILLYVPLDYNEISFEILVGFEVLNLVFWFDFYLAD